MVCFAELWNMTYATCSDAFVSYTLAQNDCWASLLIANQQTYIALFYRLLFTIRSNVTLTLKFKLQHPCLN